MGWQQRLREGERGGQEEDESPPGHEAALGEGEKVDEDRIERGEGGARHLPTTRGWGAGQWHEAVDRKRAVDCSGVGRGGTSGWMGRGAASDARVSSRAVPKAAIAHVVLL